MLISPVWSLCHAERQESAADAGQAERQAGDPRLHHVCLCHIGRLCRVTIYDTRRWGNVTMRQQQAGDGGWLAERFEEHRARLRAVAYRMLGSLPDADDAVQDAWVRFSQSGAGGVDNLGGFLTTIVARVCLNTLRARKTRREDPVGVHVPDPVVSGEDDADPETEALLADSVGLALVVVVDTLAPAERLAFVLHDLFDVPFAEIAPMVGRSEAAARQLASRARRQVHAAGYRPPDTGRAAQRTLVDAFFAAARDGDLGKLTALLYPDVVLIADGGTAHPQASAVLHGAAAVARRAARFIRPVFQVHPALVNGAAGAVLTYEGRPVALLGFTIAAGRITEIDAITDHDRLSRLDLPVPGA
jgi:RNA polymerase sigma-70 factor, ECF subfamily